MNYIQLTNLCELCRIVNDDDSCQETIKQNRCQIKIIGDKEKMKIAIVMKGLSESSDHILICDKDELHTIMSAFTFYCNENKRKQKAKSLLRQFETELQIYSI